MTLRRCPVCGEEPSVTRVLDRERGLGTMAECRCAAVAAFGGEDLEDAWERYCEDPESAGTCSEEADE